MSKRSVIVIALFGVSVVIMILRAETTYQHFTSTDKWWTAFGYGFSPWIFGLIIAVINDGFARVTRRRTRDFSSALLGGTAIAMVALVPSTLWTAAREQHRESVYNDAMLLMGAGAWVPGIAAYCNKYVEPNEQLLAAAVAWNKRHEAELKQTVRAIEWAGGLTQEEKNLIDGMAFSLLKKKVETQSDKAECCQFVAQSLASGTLDLANREDTALPLRRIMKLNIR
jgi:hypothetical protein